MAFLANVVFPQYQDQGFSVFRADNLFWDAFARYDAGWYHGIASQGYVYGEGGRNNLAFFPVYPDADAGGRLAARRTSGGLLLRGHRRCRGWRLPAR